MTIDKSLKVKAGGAKQRNVLTRVERLAKMKERERWTPESSIIGMPKVRVDKISMKKKKKTKEEPAADTKKKK